MMVCQTQIYESGDTGEMGRFCTILLGQKVYIKIISIKIKISGSLWLHPFRGNVTKI